MKLIVLDQITQRIFGRCIKTQCKAANFNQQMTLDLDDDDSYRLTSHIIMARNSVQVFTPDDIQL